VGLCNHVLDRDADSPRAGTILGVDNRPRLALQCATRLYNADHNHSLMRRIAADGVAWSVCLYVHAYIRNTVNPAKTAELIEMPLGSGGPT